MVCERWVETGTDSYIDPTSPLLTIARCVIFKNPLSTFSASWLGLLNRASRVVLSLQAGPHSCLPVSNWLNSRRYLPIFFYNAHLLSLLLPLIYTGSSLIDGSVKGQYITVVRRISFQKVCDVINIWIFLFLSFFTILFDFSKFLK